VERELSQRKTDAEVKAEREATRAERRRRNTNREFERIAAPKGKQQRKRWS
jgi:hypothetical protein